MTSLSLKYQERGLSGLRNLGNTCFLNSATQCMSNVLLLTDYILETDFSNLNESITNTFQKSVIHSYKDMIDKLWNNNNAIIIPNAFIMSLIKLSTTQDSSFRFDGRQQDSQEFLVLLIDTLHTALEREVNITIKGEVKDEIDKMALDAMKAWKTHFKNNYSQVIDIFYGQLVSSLTCQECNHISRAYDPICCFCLPIPNGDSPNIVDCWDLFNRSETLDDENMWKCDNCNDYRTSTKKIQIWKTPKILIVVLKRFKKHPLNRTITSKNTTFISFSTDIIDLSKYCVGYDKDNSTYKLCGIINHSGSVNGGHYYSYCLNGNGKWYDYNDDFVNVISVDNIVTPNAYCLFYEKV